MSNFVETSIPWIGQVPTDWDIKPLFSVATENKTKNKDRNENVLSLSYGRIIRRDLSKNFGLLPENFDGYQVVETGYIIIRSTDLQNDKKSLRVGLVKANGVITSAYIGLSPSNTIHPEYLFYYLNMCDLKKVFYSLGGGLRQSLRFEEFKRFPVIVPPLEEQKLISRYLDKKTEQIDRLVAKIQKKIELLKEQRTSLINQCVTKGLDPNVEMKDSGVEWIGEIPKHWTTSKIKFLSETISKGTTPSTIGREILDEGPIFYIKMSDFGLGKVNTPNSYIDFETNELLKRSSLCENDILFAITGEVGKTVIVNKEVVPANTNQNISFIRLKDKRNVRYTWYWLSSGTLLSQLKNLYNVSTLPSLSMEDLGNLSIPQPPGPEQEQLVKYLDEQTQLIEKQISVEQKRTKLLIEYRQSLISSAVTGKVRVTEDLV